MKMNVTVEGMLKALNYAGHAPFESDSKLYNLNIVGIREDNPIPNAFNDLMVIFWKYEGRWNLIQMQCTTLPGLINLQKPINPKGCAILKPGRYRGVWRLDLHNGKYLALCQRNGNVTVYRDNDKDVDYDMIEGKEETGANFGINIHRAHSVAELETVGPYSAGCQVIQDSVEFDLLIYLCKEAREIWGNSFTYTLIKESDYKNANA